MRTLMKENTYEMWITVLFICKGNDPNAFLNYPRKIEQVIRPKYFNEQGVKQSVMNVYNVIMLSNKEEWNISKNICLCGSRKTCT